jgi:hypothetical protein
MMGEQVLVARDEARHTIDHCLTAVACCLEHLTPELGLRGSVTYWPTATAL